MKGLSLFSSSGIGETYLKDIGVDIIVANELMEKRANLHSKLFPYCKMICGDISNPQVFEQIMNAANGVEFIIASPPCQGMSIAGKNRDQDKMVRDTRNTLINYVFDAIEQLSPQYILIENVPQLLKIKIPYQGNLLTVVEILNIKFGEAYEIDAQCVDAANYGVPQTRKRAIIKLYPKGSKWDWPIIEKHKISVKEAIGHLPSLEAGESSDIKWHYARPHTKNNIECMQHTPTGCSAFSNKIYYPKKDNGERVKGYHSSYRRIKWDEPAPTITIRNDCIASQRNVHPGYKKSNGLYSDARVLTPLELMLLTSLPQNWNIPDDTPEILVRQIIGEAIPPLMIKKIVQTIPTLKQ